MQSRIRREKLNVRAAKTQSEGHKLWLEAAGKELHVYLRQRSTALLEVKVKAGETTEKVCGHWQSFATARTAASHQRRRFVLLRSCYLIGLQAHPEALNFGDLHQRCLHAHWP